MIAVLNLLCQLKRSMESDLEKIALPLVLKTGETNRSLFFIFTMTINLLHHYHHRQVPEGGLQHRLGPHGGERLAKPGDRHRDQRADHEQEPSDKDHCFQTSCLHHRQASFF